MAKAGVAKKSRKRKHLSKVRLAVIGCGPMANNVHLPSFSSYKDVQIVGLCDVNEKALKETSAKYGVKPCFTDYQEMVEKTKPDAILAIGQPEIMFRPVYWCLERGLHAYVEKPLGINIHQARLLADAAEKNNCITQVSFQRRACPLLVKLRTECLKRGPITHAVCEFYKCDVKPYVYPRDHMMDDGVHAIDTLRWICGGEVIDVQCETKRVGVPDRNFIIAMLHFDSGATGVLINSWASGRRVFRVEMHAPGICAEGNPEGKAYIYADNDVKGVEYNNQEVAGSKNALTYVGFERKNREFIDCVKAGKLPQSHFGDALRTMEVAETILALTLLQDE